MASDEYPRVASITYRIVSDEPHEYGRGAELDGELPGFAFRLRHRVAVFTPTVHFGSEDDALTALNPFLRAWELDAVLRHGPGTLDFRFVTSHIQEAAPRPDVVEISGAATLTLTGHPVTLTLTFNKNHPSPPQGFAVDEFVETLGDLFLLARGTPRTLLYIAYSMTTCLAHYCGGLTEASTRLGISRGVLDKINELANARGVGAEVRQFNARVQRAPLLPAEREWLMQVLELIVRRAGAATAGAPVSDVISLATHPAPGQ